MQPVPLDRVVSEAHVVVAVEEVVAVVDGAVVLVLLMHQIRVEEDQIILLHLCRIPVVHPEIDLEMVMRKLLTLAHRFNPAHAYGNRCVLHSDFLLISVSIIEDEVGRRNPSSTFTGSETAANLNSANSKSVTVKAKWTANCSSGLSVNGVKNFSYTGSVQTFTACPGETYKLEVWGAQGGGNNGLGGYGGYSYGSISFSEKTSLYVVVGQQGSASTGYSISGGYNGGGSITVSSQITPSSISKVSADSHLSSGGGATHIATKTGLLSSLSSYKSSVLIVAGGGGGTGWSPFCNKQRNGYSQYYCSGGGYIGNEAVSYNAPATDSGGTQTRGGYGVFTQPTATECDYRSKVSGSNGSFGQGANGYWDHPSFGGSAGGGGGYYGGGTSSSCNEVGGGGGSGYIGNSALSNKRMYCFQCTASTSSSTYTVSTTSTGAHVANAANTGNGYARITYLGT